MSTILFPFFVFLFVAIFVVSIGIGIGFVLSKMISGMGIGMAILAGAIFSVGIIDFWARLLHLINKTEEDSDDIEGLDIDEPLVIMPERLLKRSKLRTKKKKR
jgi:hypothetical protein